MGGGTSTEAIKLLHQKQVHNISLISMLQASVISLQRWLDPRVATLPEQRVLCGSQSRSPTNRSFSSPHEINVDTVWQWSMRLWFLIIAWKALTGAAWVVDRAWKMGVVCKESVSFPVWVHLWTCGDDDLYFPAVIHFLPPQNIFHSPTTYVHKTHACCYGDSCGSRGRGRTHLGRDRKALEDVPLTQWWRAVQNEADISYSRESPSSWMEGEAGEGDNCILVNGLEVQQKPSASWKETV